LFFADYPFLQSAFYCTVSLLVFSFVCYDMSVLGDFALCGARPKGFQPSGHLTSAAALDQLIRFAVGTLTALNSDLIHYPIPTKS
ncbi:MAG: hypothetical protein ACI4JF_05780, partial [Oscillospiraceae bacterium]